jgi:DNA-binding NtrC family response regulator
MNDESRILLVDDEPDIAFALSISLEDNGQQLIHLTIHCWHYILSKRSTIRGNHML